MPPKTGQGAVVEHLRFDGSVREVTSTGRLGPGSPCSASRTTGNPRRSGTDRPSALMPGWA